VAEESEMCPFSGPRGDPVGDRAAVHHQVFPEAEVKKAQRKRVTCPVCKRRLLGWVSVGMCEEKLRVVVPPHKRKAWWKKKGARR
jgi:hypothetical protein